METTRDALEFLRNEFQRPQFVKILNGVDAVVYLNQHSGESVTIAMPKPPLRIKLGDLESLTGFVKTRWATNDESPCTILVDRNAVTAFESLEGFRENQVTLHLDLSEEMEELETGFTGTPKEVIGQLRYLLKGCHFDPPDVMTKLTDLRFETSTEENHKNAPRDEAIAKSFKAKVTQAEQIPDEMSITLIAYPDIESFTSVTIKMQILVDPSQGKLAIRPFPGEYYRAIRESLMNIAEAIRRDVPFCKNVYLGNLNE